jgi:hypothetical protein
LLNEGKMKKKEYGRKGGETSGSTHCGERENLANRALRAISHRRIDFSKKKLKNKESVEFVYVGERGNPSRSLTRSERRWNWFFGWLHQSKIPSGRTLRTAVFAHGARIPLQ